MARNGASSSTWLAYKFHSQIAEEKYPKGKIKEIRQIRLNQLALQRYHLSPREKIGLPSAVKNYHCLPKVGDQAKQRSCAAGTVCYYDKTSLESKTIGNEG